MIRTLLALSTAAAAAVGLAAAPAQAAPAPALRERAQRLVADGAPGVIVMSRRGARTRYAAAGYADTATGRPMSGGLQFRIASVTKTFTATVVLQLAAEHRLRLDDTVDRWLPGLVPGAPITVRQLLQHTSGLPEYALDPRIQSDPARDWTPRELVGIALDQPRFTDGGWHYANTNYILLGLIAEKATGRSFTAELNRRIIGPLRLTHTALPAGTSFTAPYVHGYYGDYGDVSTLVSPSSGWTSGGMISTAGDVARFHRALFGGRLLPAAEQRALTATIPVVDEGRAEDYGLGVYRVRLSCGYAWGHDGGWPGYRTWTYTRPGRQAVITYNSNAADAVPAFQKDLAATADAAVCG
ncbi:serine hydrolase domain-containing protein [Actinomadura parmotrematis]|uniref:Beta-lactamase family protein n=1 Tax=Actinomadura parmotrematis TaxID=2864039 RepID=A0ABS7FNH6_9ACTN|nr:serine hydrolase domain-containing protein [Actinomadura parmotrematis]MBW8481871.1 beta-lactamase family protein [Actinomadura parmotrematis]